MASPNYECRRSRILGGFILCIWAILAGRLIQLQWIDRVTFSAKAERQKLTQETIPARPGEIVDRRGHVLAMTVTQSSLYLNPSKIEEPQVVAQQIAAVLDIDEARLLQRILDSSKSQFIWVKRRISTDEADAIRQLELPPTNWGFRDEYRRTYPQGVLAAHILGTRDIDGIGQGGLEQTMDQVIRGTDGSRALVRDARGAVIDVHQGKTKPPEHGKVVTLTIDSVIQALTEQELDRITTKWKPLSSCAIVLEPHSGEILAMASRPVFDPNQPAPENSLAWTNQNVAAVFEPGSTFKPFVVASAMELGLLKHDDEFYCERGAYRMKKRVLHDHHKYGWLSLTDVLVKSSNIGMAKIAERLGRETLFDVTQHWGFGRKTGIELPGELKGLLRPLEKWNDYSLGSIPMGQELAVTPLQLISAHASLANGGRLINPHLVKTAAPEGVGVGESQDSSSVVVSRTASSDIARWLIRGPMTAVVNRGTAKSGRIPGINVFGKTGTAQKVDPETGTYSNSDYVCSYVCGAPSEAPEVIVLVVVDSPTIGGPHYGGNVAGPAGKEILERTLITSRSYRSRIAEK